jgi:serine/threonine protein phosphatase PrpC
MIIKDHKPDDPAEQVRIYEAGGRISKSCAGDVLRVENHLAMTRVLGDFSMDKQIVPPLADIIQYPRNSLASFVILACDGIWDVMSNEEVALFVVHRATSHKLEEISSLLLDECLRRKSTDNMSVYIIKV